MRIRRSFAWLGIIGIGLLFAVQVTGCSVIGLLVGFGIDQGVPKVRVVPAHGALQVSPGARVVLHLEDGTTVSGRYLGVARLPDEAYVQQYRRWHHSLPPGKGFPALGDSITLTWRSGKELATTARTFAGFGYRQLMVSSATGEGSVVVPFENLVAMSSLSGPSFPVEHLVTLDVSGELPSATALQVLAGTDTTLTGLDRVEQAEIPTVRHGARNGFLVGLVVDALVVVIAAATYEPPTCEIRLPPPQPIAFGSGVRSLEAPFDVWAGRLVTTADSAAGRTGRRDASALVARAPAGD